MDQSSRNAGPFKPGFYVVDDIQRLSPDTFHLHLSMRSPAWRPPTDVYETEEAVIVRVEIAGMHETDFSIILDGRYLSIRGVRQDVAERRAYHQMEIRFGEFNVDVEMPATIDVENVQAIYQNGFLKIVLPKVHIRIE
jgi:HSP20 family protein